MSGNRYKTSVALCTYNGAKYIHQQMESILHQSVLPDEIVISDDRSSDETISIIKEFLKTSKVPIRLFEQSNQLGVFKNFQFVIEQCQNEIIFTSDQDDYWKADKIKLMLEQFVDQDATDMVYSNAEVVTKDLQTVISLLWEKRLLTDLERGQASVNSLLFLGRSIAGCTMAFKKSFYDRVAPIPNGIYHDDWIATAASISTHVGVVLEPLVKYRQHEDNVVGIKRGGKLSFYKSLLTNVRFYHESNQYIYNRHKIVFSALREHSYLSEFVKVDDLEACLSLFRVRAEFSTQPFIYNIKKSCSNLSQGNYRFLNGWTSFLKDLYDIVFIELLIKTGLR